MSRLKRWLSFLLLTNKSFRLFRKFGIHLTPVHYYSPIPDIRELEASHWGSRSSLIGLDMDLKGQQAIMKSIFVKYRNECDFPRHPVELDYAYFVENSMFGYVSAAAMHCFVRHYRPRKIVEVGAGYSTRVLAGAARLNSLDGNGSNLTAIDPFPSRLPSNGVPGLSSLIAERVQDVNTDIFTCLQENDILSIDTSHVVKTGGDVTYLYLKIIPRLAPGVIVHIHDIFFPCDYPLVWLEKRRFWNEQYLLQAFLSHNKSFQVLWGQKYAEIYAPELYKSVFGDRTSYEENYDSYSFWMRRTLNG